MVAGTYGTLLKIPVITANIKGLITGLSEQQIPVVDDLVTGGATKLLSAEQGKKLQANKVEKTKSFNDAFGGDIDHYIPPHALAGFTSCADFPVGSRVLVDSASAFPDIPSIDGHVYIETKRTYVTPGKLQIAYGYYNARIATRAAGTSGGYSEWRYMASLDSNVASATKLQTPRTISLIGDGAGSASFDGSANTSINLTLNDVNNSAGTYGANNLEIPTFTLNKKGLLTSAINRQFPSATTSQYGAAILYDGLDSYSNSHAATANIVRHLNAAKVDINKSFNDAFGSDVDNYIAVGNLKGFTSCADFPVGSRMIVDVPALPDMPNLGSSAIYFETKRTYIHPGKLQIAYGYNNGRIATRAAGTGGPYSEWRYMASLDSNVASATKLQTPRTISLIGDGAGSASFDGSANTSINLTLNDVNNSAGTYGANNLEIPTFTLNKKGLLTSAGNRAFPYAGVGQYGAAILYDGLDSYSTSHSATANIVRHLNAVKVEKTKSFADAFGSDIDYYIHANSFSGFTSCADFPVGSRVLLDSASAFPDMPDLKDNHVYIETKRTYIHPGKLQIAYSYGNGRTATRSAATYAGYSDWVYTADTSSISRYRQDLDATRIYSPNSQKVLSITDSGVDVPDLRVSGSVYCSKYKSNSRVWVTDHTEHNAQGMDVGSLFVGGAFSEDIHTPDNGIYAKGIVRSDAGFQGKLLAKDSRIFKPLNAESGGISAYFVTEWGLNNDNAGGSYGDFLSLNTYGDASAGMQNGLFFDKGGKRIVHYQSVFGSGNWGSGKTLAYAEDVLSTNGGTMNATINFNLSNADGAFHKLIEGSTSTDGGYIAVGNHGSDKGYVELGTTDDGDAAIYARKRNTVNTVLDEAVILGSDGNTSFPKSVFIHNVPSGYGTCGLVAGNADNAAYTGCNIDITSWFGLGIKASNSGERTVVFNARTGDISNKGSINTVGVVNGKGLGVASADGLGSGLSLYNGAMHGMPTYGIAFAQTQHHGGCGYVDGDWATYFTMEGAYNRGWIFKSQNYGNVASISSQGLLSIPTMKMDRSNFQVVTGSNYTVTYDYATRIVRIVMKVMSAVGVGHSTSPFKVVEGRWTATFTLPITLQVRLSAEFAFQQVGLPGYKLWDAEAGEWHAWCAPPGHRGSTESAVTVDVVRWRGGEGEPVDGYLTVVGFF